ncbi:HNH endonuclease [Streptomyces sp. TE5632]
MPRRIRCPSATVPPRGRRGVRRAVGRRGGADLSGAYGRGGIPLQRQRAAELADREPNRADRPQKELGATLPTDTREICGSRGDVRVHHVRALPDLAHAGRQPSDRACLMLHRQRKTVVACDTCHDRIHSERPAGPLTQQSLESRMTGKPSCPVRREAAWNRNRPHREHLTARPTRRRRPVGDAGASATTSSGRGTAGPRFVGR